MCIVYSDVDYDSLIPHYVSLYHTVPKLGDRSFSY